MSVILHSALSSRIILLSFLLFLITHFPSPQVHFPVHIVPWKGPEAFFCHFSCQVNALHSSTSVFQSVALLKVIPSFPALFLAVLCNSDQMEREVGFMNARSSSSSVETPPLPSQDTHTCSFSWVSWFMKDSGLFGSCTSNISVLIDEDS